MVFIVAIYDNVAAIFLHEFQETLFLAGKSSIPNAIPWPTNLCANCCSPCVFTKKWFYHVKIFAQNLWTVVLTYFREISEIESNVAFWQLKLTDQDLAFLNQVRKKDDQSSLDLEQLDANHPWSLISFTKKNPLSLLDVDSFLTCHNDWTTYFRMCCWNEKSWQGGSNLRRGCGLSRLFRWTLLSVLSGASFPLRSRKNVHSQNENVRR